MHTDTDIKYTIRNSGRAKRVRLSVFCDGRVVVTTPRGIGLAIIEKFIAEKKAWVLKKLNFLKKVDKKIVRRFSDEDYKKYKNDALQLVKAKVLHYSKIYGFEYNRISIRNQKTRWGSCSRKRNININYRILFLPNKLQDYLIIHELCHLKEFNHSNKFWSLVHNILPDYKELKKSLKNHELGYR